MKREKREERRDVMTFYSFSFSVVSLLDFFSLGSGKTLAFLIPILERLFHLNWSTIDGLGTTLTLTSIKRERERKCG
jgi:hypothetical protein